MDKTTEKKYLPKATTTLRELVYFLQELEIPFCLIGGAALGHYQVGRFTQDLDLKISISESSWPELKSALEANSKISELKTHFISNPIVPDLIRLLWGGYGVDLLIANTDYQLEVIRRAQKGMMEEVETPIASSEDIIVLKLIADRPQDRADTELLFQTIKKLDLRYIRKWCKIWEVEKRLDRLLTKRKALQKKRKK